MIARFGILCVSIAAAVCVAATAAAPPTCEKTPNNFFLYDTEAQARGAGVDYKMTLSAAFRGDEKALVVLLQVTAAGVLDGSGAQTHADVLWSLLKCWGDERFASVLHSQAPNVRSRVLEQLRYATEEDTHVRSAYPRTFEGTTGKTSNFGVQPAPAAGRG